MPSPKSGFPQMVPLPTAIIGMLEALPHVGAYVIPAQVQDKTKPRGRPFLDVEAGTGFGGFAVSSRRNSSTAASGYTTRVAER